VNPNGEHYLNSRLGLERRGSENSHHTALGTEERGSGEKQQYLGACGRLKGRITIAQGCILDTRS